MTGLHRYIAEEIATDHVDGLLTRREALRRLGLLGVSGTAAATLIAACASAETSRPTAQTSKPTAEISRAPASTTGTQPPGMAGALATSPVTWPGPQGQLKGRGRGRPDRARCWSSMRTRD